MAKNVTEPDWWCIKIIHPLLTDRTSKAYFSTVGSAIKQAANERGIALTLDPELDEHTNGKRSGAGNWIDSTCVNFEFQDDFSE